MNANLVLIPLCGLVAGVAASFTGLGGGFLMVPLLLALGFPAQKAVGASFLGILVISLSALVAHNKFANVDFRHGILLGLGGIVGTQIGARLFQGVPTDIFKKYSPSSWWALPPTCCQWPLTPIPSHGEVSSDAALNNHHMFQERFFQRYGNRVLPGHRKALKAMLGCRSEHGPHMLARCSDRSCDRHVYIPHSCGHGNRPHCQNHESQQWIEKQLDKRLPATSYLITFTLPSLLRNLAWRNGGEP